MNIDLSGYRRTYYGTFTVRFPKGIDPCEEPKRVLKAARKFLAAKGVKLHPRTSIRQDKKACGTFHIEHKVKGYICCCMVVVHKRRGATYTYSITSV